MGPDGISLNIVKAIKTSHITSRLPSPLRQRQYSLRKCGRSQSPMDPLITAIRDTWLSSPDVPTSRRVWKTIKEMLWWELIMKREAVVEPRVTESEKTGLKGKAEPFQWGMIFLSRRVFGGP